jgi:hypothetical protein
VQRLSARSSGGYGSAAEERLRVAVLITTIEPLLRQSADHEIDTSESAHATVDEILRRSQRHGTSRARGTYLSGMTISRSLVSSTKMASSFAGAVALAFWLTLW